MTNVRGSSLCNSFQQSNSEVLWNCVCDDWRETFLYQGEIIEGENHAVSPDRSLGQCLSRPTVSSKHFHRNSYFLSQQPISLSVRRLIAPTPIQPPAHKVATALHLGTVESLHLWRSEMATIYIYLNVGVYVLFGLPNNNFFCSFVHDYKYFNIMAYLNIKQQDF